MPLNRTISYRTTSELRPDPRNPRAHRHKQLSAIARSIKSFGFNAPILVDKTGQVVAGHGRLEAAKMLGLEQVPVISLDDLSAAQAKAYMLADNKLGERSDWNEGLLAAHLKELSEVALDFEIEDTGFESPEIDILIQGLDTDNEDAADDFTHATGPAVSTIGDLWTLGDHNIYCGSALDSKSYDALSKETLAAAVFTDPPYNVRISGNVSGLGKARHREFAMASGEMSPPEFARFLTDALGHCKARSRPGALIYTCMDWRHMAEIEVARNENALDFMNLCVWVKTNGGMGSFYRSQHELVFVFRNGSSLHRNNIQLGSFGRNRTNVWHYAGATGFARHTENENEWRLHPTVKPIRLVADAILDSTIPGEIVLDPFLGSGTTLLAAEKTNRWARAIELDPLYVDTAITRWQRLTGRDAYDSSGESFALRQSKVVS